MIRKQLFGGKSMKAVEEEMYQQEGTHIHLIPTNKFKTIHLIAKFKAPLTRETVSKRALLPYVLRQGTKSYPSRAALENELDELYGAGLGIDGGKRGNSHILSFRLEVANDKFIPHAPNMLDAAVELLKEVIFEPNVKDNQFDEDIFNRERETLKQRIESVIEDKMNYAQMRLIDEMCEDEAYALHVQGYLEDLESLTSSDLYSYYKQLLAEDQLDFYVLGDFDTDQVKNKLADSFVRKQHGSAPEQTSEPRKQISEVREIIEKQNIQQAKLHIGYRTHCTYEDAGYYALQVFNGIFGGFPNSKLFMNVREKHSLAYYAASRLESHKGLMFVFSGIAPEDYEKARNIIELQLKDMRAGSFEEDILEETKGLIINDILETLDHPQGIIELLYQQILSGKHAEVDDMISGIRKVTKDDVIKAANSIEEDTVYLLTNNGGGEDA